MTKVVINKCFGGFGLTKEAVEWMRQQGCEPAEQATLPGEYYSDGSGPAKDFGSFGRDIPRDDSHLLEAINEFGSEEVSGRCADLKVVDIPDDVEWQIKEYDGREWVAEKHRTWS